MNDKKAIALTLTSSLVTPLVHNAQDARRDVNYLEPCSNPRDAVAAAPD
jgi:hypothetical protein